MKFDGFFIELTMGNITIENFFFVSVSYSLRHSVLLRMIECIKCGILCWANLTLYVTYFITSDELWIIHCWTHNAVKYAEYYLQQYIRLGIVLSTQFKPILNDFFRIVQRVFLLVLNSLDFWFSFFCFFSLILIERFDLMPTF